jgi:hypothetical protein
MGYIECICVKSDSTYLVKGRKYYIRKINKFFSIYWVAYIKGVNNRYELDFFRDLNGNKIPEKNFIYEELKDLRNSKLARCVKKNLKNLNYNQLYTIEYTDIELKNDKLKGKIKLKNVDSPKNVNNFKLYTKKEARDHKLTALIGDDKKSKIALTQSDKIKVVFNEILRVINIKEKTGTDATYWELIENTIKYSPEYKDEFLKFLKEVNEINLKKFLDENN